jgi:hypothetical protein
MCRKVLFIGTIIVAASTVTFAQYMPGCAQYSGIVGFGATHAGQGGSLGLCVDNNFQTGMDSQASNCGPCGGTYMTTNNSGFIDQGTAAGGCGGVRGACQTMMGGGIQGQQTGYVPSPNGITCFPISTQSQMVGGMASQSMFNTCGTGSAQATQDGAISESQGVTTPSTSGNQYQLIAGSQGGMAYGVPTSFSSAGGTIGGGATQCQTFGGITAPL